MDHTYGTKQHPSEALEFATISPQFERTEYFSSKHNEHAAGQREKDNVDSSTESAIHPSESLDDLFAGLPTETKALAGDAKAAALTEHQMTFMQGLKLYPKAIGWSVLLSLTIVMEGYDTALINGFYAFPEFRKSYGHQLPSGDYEISPAWQSGLTNGQVVGEILGLFFNGLITERYGYRYTMIGALALLCLWIFFAFFAFNIAMLLTSQILCGLSWGVFQTLTTTYAAEVMPVALRAYLTSNVNLCWLFGQLFSVGVIRGLVNTTTKWSYRIPFALQWVWALFILVGVVFAPESPWWLIRHERDDEARAALLRLTRRGQDFNVDETVAMMKHTNGVEKYLSKGIGFADCFKGPDLRRTEIACMVWVAQSLCGSSLTGYATYFYVQAGFAPPRAFDLSCGMYALAICGGILSWFSMRIIGRRTLYIVGLSLIFVILLVGGGISTRADNSSTAWILGSLIIFQTFIYDSTVGPVCYTLVAEIPSTRLRVKTVVLARIAYNIAQIVCNILTPRMLNPTAWDWKGKACWLYAGTCFLCLAWCWFRLPEPKGLTYMELDILFEKKAGARKFKQFQVNLASTGYFSLSDNAQSTGWRGYI